MRLPHPALAPSLLSADMTCLADEVRRIEDAAAKWLHLDVMDGRFVPNISFGAGLIAALRPHYSGHFDAHLMTAEPERFVDDFAEAGCDSVTVHFEATLHILRLLARIRTLCMKAGVAILPSTAVSSVVELLPHVDILLVMTVNPGFSGQTLIPSVLPKIRELEKIRRAQKLEFLISVDGGVTSQNAENMVHSGADVLVSGSEFFSHETPHEFVQAVARMRRSSGGNIV